MKNRLMYKGVHIVQSFDEMYHLDGVPADDAAREFTRVGSAKGFISRYLSSYVKDKEAHQAKARHKPMAPRGGKK